MVRKLLLVNETSINANKFAHETQTDGNKPKTNKMYTQEDRDNYSNKRVETAGFYVLNYFVAIQKIS